MTSSGLSSSSSPLCYKGSNCLRMRLMLSTLSGRPLIIEQIHTSVQKHSDYDDDGDVNSNHTNTIGLSNAEENLLQLLLKLTNGSQLDISDDRTRLHYRPGLIYGGKLEHDCSLERSISYYLELLMCLAPFCKEKLDITLAGITNDALDASVDSLKQTALPLLTRYLNIVDSGELELRVLARGLHPEGGGQVRFRCPLRKTLRPVQLVTAGKIKRIRGIAFAARVSPQVTNRIVSEAKGLLLKFLPDVYIDCDHLKGPNSGRSPGFGLSLVAETLNGCNYVGEALSNPKGSPDGPSLPEDIARQAVHALVEEVYRGGCVSSLNQGLALLFMALGQNDISKLQLGPLSPHSVQLLRHMRDFLQITFKLEVDQAYEHELAAQYRKGSQKVLATALGIGYVNLSKNAI